MGSLSLTIFRAVQKTGLFLRVYNFATVNRRDIIKCQNFVKKKIIKLTAVKYSLLNLHKTSLHAKLCLS